MRRTGSTVIKKYVKHYYFIHPPICPSVHCLSSKCGLRVYYVPGIMSNVETQRTKTLSSPSRPHSSVDRGNHSRKLCDNAIQAQGQGRPCLLASVLSGARKGFGGIGVSEKNLESQGWAGLRVWGRRKGRQIRGRHNEQRQEGGTLWTCLGIRGDLGLPGQQVLGSLQRRNGRL